jgi:hypothetical protein
VAPGEPGRPEIAPTAIACGGVAAVSPALKHDLCNVLIVYQLPRDCHITHPMKLAFLQAVGVIQLGGIATQVGLVLGVGVTLALLVRSGKRFADTSKALHTHIWHNCVLCAMHCPQRGITFAQTMPLLAQRMTPTTGRDPRYGPSRSPSSHFSLFASLPKALPAASDCCHQRATAAVAHSRIEYIKPWGLALLQSSVFAACGPRTLQHQLHVTKLPTLLPAVTAQGFVV